jgi:hypothetical protein
MERVVRLRKRGRAAIRVNSGGQDRAFVWMGTPGGVPNPSSLPPRGNAALRSARVFPGGVPNPSHARFARLNRAPLGLASIASLLLVAGCWNGLGSTAGGDAGGGGSTGSVACNGLQPGSTFVQPANTGVAQPPAAGGGQLTAGSYHLAALTYYPSVSCSAAGIATTMMVAPTSETTGTLQLVTGGDNGQMFDESLSYAIRGTSLSVRIECFVPDSSGLTGSLIVIPFNASPIEVQLYTAAGSCGSRIDTYQKD